MRERVDLSAVDAPGWNFSSSSGLVVGALVAVGTARVSFFIAYPAYLRLVSLPVPTPLPGIMQRQEPGRQR